MDKIKAFLASPVGAFVIDLVDYAILGAAIAALALPDTATAKEAVGLIIGGALGAVKAGARLALKAFVASKQPA
jgi:hypothetical protein